MYYRIVNAIIVGWYGFKNPEVFQRRNFNMLCKLFGAIIKVAKEEKPQIMHIGYVQPNGEEKPLVSIWAGSGIGASPIKRISELTAENSLIKAELEKIKKSL